MITQPEEFHPVRYSDQFATEETCVKGLKQREQVSWQEQPPDEEMNNLRPTEMFIVSWRGVGSVWRRYAIHDPNPENLTMVYQLRDSEAPSGQRIWPDGNGGDLNFNIAVAMNPYTPHGPVMVCGRTLGGIGGRYLGYSWMWLDGVPNPSGGMNSVIRFVFPTPAQIVNSGSFTIVRFNGGVPVEVQTVVFAAGDATCITTNLAVSDYYTIIYNEDQHVADPMPDPIPRNFGLGSAGMTVTFECQCSVLRHLPVEQAYPNVSQLGSMCTRAASLRLTEMAAPLNVQGECAVVRGVVSLVIIPVEVLRENCEIMLILPFHCGIAIRSSLTRTLPFFLGQCPRTSYLVGHVQHWSRKCQLGLQASGELQEQLPGSTLAWWLCLSLAQKL